MTKIDKVIVIMDGLMMYLESKGYVSVPGDYVLERDGSRITDTARFQNEQGVIVTVTVSSN